MSVVYHSAPPPQSSSQVKSGPPLPSGGGPSHSSVNIPQSGHIGQGGLPIQPNPGHPGPPHRSHQFNPQTIQKVFF